MIALVLVVGIAVALCVAGWVSLVRDAARGVVAPPSGAPSPAAAAVEGDALPEAVAV